MSIEKSPVGQLAEDYIENELKKQKPSDKNQH